MPDSKSDEKPAGCLPIFLAIVLIVLIAYPIIGTFTGGGRDSQTEPVVPYAEDAEKKELHRTINAWAYLQFTSLQAQGFCVFRQEECADLERCARVAPERDGYRLKDLQACRKAYRKWYDN